MFFFFQAEDGIRDLTVTGVQTCALPISGDGKVYFASEQGVVSVVANTADWRVISSHEFHEKIYATPVIDRDRICLRSEQALYCFQRSEERRVGEEGRSRWSPDH